MAKLIVVVLTMMTMDTVRMELSYFREYLTKKTQIEIFQIADPSAVAFQVETRTRKSKTGSRVSSCVLVRKAPAAWNPILRVSSACSRLTWEPSETRS